MRCFDCNRWMDDGDVKQCAACKESFCVDCIVTRDCCNFDICADCIMEMILGYEGQRNG